MLEKDENGLFCLRLGVRATMCTGCFKKDSLPRIIINIFFFKFNSETESPVERLSLKHELFSAFFSFRMNGKYILNSG